MKIRIQRKKPPEWLVLYIWIMPFLLPFFLEFLHLPSLIKYTLDAAWLALMFFMVVNRVRIPNTQVKTLAKIVLLLLVITIIGFLRNYQSIMYYLWGFRNNFRFFVFFLACIFYLTQQSAEKCLAFFDAMFWVNLPLVLLQYFVLHKEQDYVGGVFGTMVGCNANMNIFLVIVITKSILYFTSRKESLGMCLLKCGMALVIAVVSELKIFFVELLLIIFMALFMTKFSFRKYGMMIFCIIGVVVGAQLVSVLFPVFKGWFSISGIMEIINSESGYTSKNDINRLTAVAFVVDHFLPTFMDKLIGLGLGNCDYASFPFLTTAFYRAYKRTNYVWFSSAFLALETGFIGLAVYISFFVVLFFGVRKLEKMSKANQIYCQMAKIMAVLSVVMIIYNASMRTEAGYMMYFALSLPFIKQKNTNTKAMSI